MVLRQVGGIRQLCELIDEYGDELEADFAQFYRLDLTDVWRGNLTPRHALVLAGQLAYTAESRFRAMTLGGPQWIGWERITSLLADIYDALNDNSVVTVKAAGGKARSPEEYPRPQRIEPEVIEAESIEDFPIYQVLALTQK